MERARLWFTMGMAIACFDATAQLYKCKGPDGRIVYSDAKCEAAASGDALKVTPMGTTKSDREKAMEQAAADRAAADKAASDKAAERRALAREVADEMAARGRGGAQPQASGPYQLTSSDRDRIRELEMLAGSQGAYPEQKQAAQMQISRIRSGADAKLSSSERSRRDSLMSDLVSTDKEKRGRVLRELQNQ
jgi:hypothetical protein